ncbi:MAG TPA: hypothetical protein VD886_20015, partial [Herpetosiphonaceae bacterium]|nr:hypothetical protein [Herpetosiphonaceae bacterium]
LRWNGANWTHFGPDQGLEPPANPESDVRIRRFAQDTNGVIWAAGSQRGLLRFAPEGNRWHREDVLGEADIRGVAAFADGSVWAAGPHMIASSPKDRSGWVLQGRSETTIGSDTGSLVQDGSGRVWIGAYDGGVSVFERTGWRALQR